MTQDLPHAEPDADGYYAVAKSSDVKHDKLTTVVIAQQPITLTRLDAQIYAFSAICPHAYGPLGQGYLEGDTIECPIHYWRFRFTDGVAVEPPGPMGIPCYDVKEEKDLVYVSIPE